MHPCLFPFNVFELSHLFDRSTKANFCVVEAKNIKESKYFDLTVSLKFHALSHLHSTLGTRFACYMELKVSLSN